MYSFLLTVKEKEERLVHITYTTRNITTSQGSQVFYHLSYFKQPGREQDDYTVSLTYPKKYRPVRAPEGTIKSQETLLIEKLIKEDEIFKFEFATRNYENLFLLCGSR